MTAVDPGRVFTSQNGWDWSVTWQEPGVGSPHGIAFGRESSVCVGVTVNLRPLVLTAGKDLKWKPQDVSLLVPATAPQSRSLGMSDVVYGESHFVAVGKSHLILRGTELAPPPALSGLQIQSEGAAEFSLTTIPGDQFRVESSADLIHWAPLAEGTSTSASVRILDPGYDRVRFYRAMIE